MLYIRTDMNRQIASGHLMRCLTIAKELKKRGEDVTFLLADEEAYAFVSEQGFPCHVLGTNWSDCESELKVLKPYLREVGAEILLVDSYFVTPNYFRELKSFVKTAYIDDLNRSKYDLDLLICYAPYYRKFRLEEQYPASTRLLLGPSFFPLRESFLHLGEKRISRQVEKVLLLSGGTDGGVLEYFTDILLAQGIHSLDIVCGILSDSYAVLCDKYASVPGVRVFRAKKEIAHLMSTADLAITAGGTTLYELCACGTPSISYVFADNQRDNVRAFEEMGLIPCAGDIRIDNIAERTKDILLNFGYEQRKERSVRMRSLFDGRGAARIADELLHFAEHS